MLLKGTEGRQRWEPETTESETEGDREAGVEELA